MIYHSNPFTLKSKYISLDSRQIYEPSQTAFFAVKGVHHDGHQFIEQLHQQGIREFIVERAAWHGPLTEKASQWENTSIWVVENSIQSLQEIVRLHRINYTIPVVGITGSNGKTICKEWLSVLLKNKYQVIKSPKSFNSQIGVPLSVWGINAQHTVGVFEAGISQKNEMARLEPIIRPNMGILSHMGEAHGKNFASDEEKLAEKLQLFKHCKTLVFRDTEHSSFIRANMAMQNPSCELIAWSTEDSNQAIFVHWSKTAQGSQIKCQKKNQSEVFLSIKTALTDEASLENLTNCIIQASLLGMTSIEIDEASKWVKPVSMRLEIKEGLRGNKIIDDSYNNDIDGIKFALPLFKQYEEKKKVLILSDLIENGLNESELFKQIAQYIQPYAIDTLIGIGEQIYRNKAAFDQIATYKNTEEFIKSSDLLQISNAVILLKGARKFNFEKITQALETKTHCTKLEINLDALTNNLSYYRKAIDPETKIMAMVKAFAYGTGSIEIAKILQQQDIDYLTVAYTDEGVNLRNNGIYKPIMVMNPQKEEFETLTSFSLEPQIYSFELLHALDEYSSENNINVKMHIKLDTGMKRLGFIPEEVDELCQELVNMPQVWTVSILSHLAASENPKHHDFTEEQISLFKKLATQVDYSIGYKTIWHIANSAAIQNYPNARFNMVRLGISMYGITSNPTVKIELENVISLKTYISQIKSVKKGETIGYGRIGQLQEDGRIAILAIGYADGMSRALGNGIGSVEIHGQLCPTIGAICMDMCMIDISHIEHVAVGDEAILFGGKIQIQDVAKLANTIPYELMTNISERVKRVYVRD